MVNSTFTTWQSFVSLTVSYTVLELYRIYLVYHTLLLLFTVKLRLKMFSLCFAWNHNKDVNYPYFFTLLEFQDGPNKSTSTYLLLWRNPRFPTYLRTTTPPTREPWTPWVVYHVWGLDTTLYSYYPRFLGIPMDAFNL